MKNKLLYTALLSSALIMTGCGGDSDSDSNGTQGTGDNQQPNDQLTAEQKLKIVNVAQESAGVSLRETIIFGTVDTAIYGVDEAVDDLACSSGSYTKMGDVITFNQCLGLFKSRTGLTAYQDMVATGEVVATENSYQYKNLKLTPVNQTDVFQLINGTMNKAKQGTVDTILIDHMTFAAKEMVGGKIADVNYTLSGYKADFDMKSTTELALTTTGLFTVTGSAAGDYKIQFETTKPFFVQLDPGNDDSSGFPYDGVLSIKNLTNESVTLLSANSDQKTFRYSVSLKNLELFSSTRTWEDFLSGK